MPALTETFVLREITAMRRMLAAELPMVLRIAISRVFSITSRTSEAMMLSAATMTMRPMVIEMAIFSSHRASNNGRFMVVQSSVT